MEIRFIRTVQGSFLSLLIQSLVLCPVGSTHPFRLVTAVQMSQWQEGPRGALARSAETLQNAINSTSAAKSAKEGIGEIQRKSGPLMRVLGSELTETGGRIERARVISAAPARSHIYSHVNK